MVKELLTDSWTSGHRKTKIIATIGPASRSVDVIKQLILAGANCFRLNFSHGSHDDHLKTLQNIRQAESELNMPVAVLQDLAGPKIRISEIEGDYVVINDGEQIELRPSDGAKTNAKCIYVETLDPSKILKNGHQILLSDGIISLQADHVRSDSVTCTIVKGGRLRSRAGIAFPDSVVDLPATTKKDLNDMVWGIQNKVDYVAVSFVANAQDILTLRDFIRKGQGDCHIIAKIERRGALDNIMEILEVCDGLMVARGDLGLECPLERLPLLQKGLIEQANNRGVPVIVATQMLHSMITAIRPTRAEVSDIATAVMSGADAVMLSEETAIGEHPVEAVRYLSRIAHHAERSFTFEEYRLRLRESDRATLPDAVAYAACAASIKVNAAALVACTQTGTSARLLAKYRPQQPLYGVSSSAQTMRRMALYWGVIPITAAETETHHDEIEFALKAVQLRESLPNGSRAVITGGLMAGKPGSTSVMEIREMSYR